MGRGAVRRLVTQLTAGQRRFSTGLPALSTASVGPTDQPAPGVSDASKGPTGVLQVPQRLLMGPGPANSNPRILAAQTLPLLGHMHPPMFGIMDEIRQGLRYVFQTESPYTMLVSGTGMSGMEASVVNLLEPGDKIVVGNCGVWGERVLDMASRFGAETINMTAEAGRTFSYEELEKTLKKHKPAVLFLCQGESSTGVHQSLAGLGDLCKETNTLLLVDTVCSLGGVPMFADEWGVDCIYSGSQKVLSAPPGAAPLFLSERAMQKLKSRKTKPISYYFDLNMVGAYWGWFDKRPYHHTGPISTWYAMREALALVAAEGLDASWARHKQLHLDLWDGLKQLGLEPFVENPDERLVTVNTIKVPEGVDWAAVVKNAMDKYQVELAGGLWAPTLGKIWRVGIMGYNAHPANVAMVVEAFRDGLQKQGKL